MAGVRPTNHPITGRSLPRRSTLRRFTDNGIGDLDPAVFERVGHTSGGLAEVGGRWDRHVRTSSGGAAYIGTAQPVKAARVIDGNTSGVSAVGIHVAGLRYGVSSSEQPATSGQAAIRLVVNCLTPDGLPYGVSLAHVPGGPAATFYNSATGEQIVFDGGLYEYGMRSPRSRSIGLMVDFDTDEAIAYTLDHLGEMHPIIIHRFAGGILRDSTVVPSPEVTPRVEISGAAGANLRYTRLDLDLWTD